MFNLRWTHFNWVLSVLIYSLTYIHIRLLIHATKVRDRSLSLNKRDTLKL